jgi:hypothetical protein
VVLTPSTVMDAAPPDEETTLAVEAAASSVKQEVPVAVHLDPAWNTTVPVAAAGEWPSSSG